MKGRKGVRDSSAKKRPGSSQTQEELAVVNRLYSAAAKREETLEKMREEKLNRELQQVRNPKLNNNENLKDYTPLYERVKTVIDQKKKKLTETELLVKLEKEEKLKT